MNKKVLYKSFPFSVKKTDEDEKIFSFEGYASTWDIDRGDEKILPGAFTESLKTISPVLLWQHKSFEPIGVPVTLYEDSKGLFVKGNLPKGDTFVTGRVIPQMQIGSVKKMSIGYRMKTWKWDEDILIHEKVDLYEISLVSIPMNPNADVTSMKAFNVKDVEDIDTREKLNEFLKNTGMFSKQAREFLASRFETQSKSDVKIEIAPENIDSLKEFSELLKNIKR